MSHAEPPVDPILEKQLAKEYLRRNLWLLVWAVIIILGLAVVAKLLFGEWLNRTIHTLTDRFGYGGMAGAVFAIDTFTLPVSPDLILAMIAHEKSTLEPKLALALVCAGSMIGGITGYALARWAGRTRFIRRRLHKSMERGRALFHRYGVWAVVIAGLTPIPFSIVCWMAGLYKMHPLPLALATLSRIPRMVGWYYLLKLGFSIG